MHKDDVKLGEVYTHPDLGRVRVERPWKGQFGEHRGWWVTPVLGDLPQGPTTPIVAKELMPFN